MRINMGKVKTNLTLNDVIRNEKAEELIAHYHFNSLSELVEHLVREKHERLFGPPVPTRLFPDAGTVRRPEPSLDTPAHVMNEGGNQYKIDPAEVTEEQKKMGAAALKGIAEPASSVKSKGLAAKQAQRLRGRARRQHPASKPQ
jgi:hypothetical protein